MRHHKHTNSNTQDGRFPGRQSNVRTAILDIAYEDFYDYGLSGMSILYMSHTFFAS